MNKKNIDKTQQSQRMDTFQGKQTKQGETNMRFEFNWLKRISLVIVLAGMFLLVSIVRAEGEPEPIYLNPDGTLREAATPAAVVGNPTRAEQSGQEAMDEDEPSPPQPNTNGRYFNIYLSSPANGTYGILNYADEDIMRHDTQTRQWFKSFDGTDAGLPGSADIDALAYKAINLGHIFYLSFDTPVAVPGLGTVDDSDIVAYQYVFGQGGSWSMYFKGSQNGLTTNAEDIDAIEIDGPTLYLSTVGGFSVPKAGGGTLSGGREDVIIYASNLKAFAMKIDGTDINLASTNNVRNYAFIRTMDYDWHFLGVTEKANLKYRNTSYPAVTLKPNDIGVYEVPQLSGPRAFGTVWSASGAGFPKVDAIDMVLK
jgi:hypothetical protein